MRLLQLFSNTVLGCKVRPNAAKYSVFICKSHFQKTTCEIVFAAICQTKINAKRRFFFRQQKMQIAKRVVFSLQLFCICCATWLTNSTGRLMFKVHIILLFVHLRNCISATLVQRASSFATRVVALRLCMKWTRRTSFRSLRKEQHLGHQNLDRKPHFLNGFPQHFFWFCICFARKSIFHYIYGGVIFLNSVF